MFPIQFVSAYDAVAVNLKTLSSLHKVRTFTVYVQFNTHAFITNNIDKSNASKTRSCKKVRLHN